MQPAHVGSDLNFLGISLKLAQSLYLNEGQMCCMSVILVCLSCRNLRIWVHITDKMLSNRILEKIEIFAWSKRHFWDVFSKQLNKWFLSNMSLSHAMIASVLFWSATALKLQNKILMNVKGKNSAMRRNVLKYHKILPWN